MGTLTVTAKGQVTLRKDCWSISAYIPARKLPWTSSRTAGSK